MEWEGGLGGMCACVVGLDSPGSPVFVFFSEQTGLADVCALD